MKKHFELVITIIFALILLVMPAQSSIVSFVNQLSNNTVYSVNICLNAFYNTWIKISTNILNINKLADENQKLKYEIIQLKRVLFAMHDIRKENMLIKEILNVPKHSDSIVNNNNQFIMGRVIGFSKDVLTNRATVDIGTSENFVTEDCFVYNVDGLIGRVAEVNKNRAIIEMLYDANLHVPIISSDSRIRAMLVADHDKLKLKYVSSDSNLVLNEELYTSGDGNIYPHGMLVGHVTNIDKTSIEVTPSIALSKLEYVFIERKL